jgi:hypothetical protein
VPGAIRANSRTNKSDPTIPAAVPAAASRIPVPRT